MQEGRTIEDLLRLLDDKDRRVSAAVELCHRGDTRALRPVLNPVRRLGRADAVRVLGAVVRFGASAIPDLIAKLSSHKAYVRHGSALALAHLGGDPAIEAIVDSLLREPTDIWRELARAVGHLGSSAVMPLVSRLSRASAEDQALARERIAWALAHVAARGERTVVDTLANGHSGPIADVARYALELLPNATRDDLHVRGVNTPFDQTVNRAFSRRFFEALERGESVVANPALIADGADVSPSTLLDEADLLAIDGGEDEDRDDSGAGVDTLDEGDLLPS
jgi:hypothetical protein